MADALIRFEWVAAALAPWAMAPHPNFSTPSVEAHQLLALVADYRLPELERYQGKLNEDLTPWQSDLITHSEASLLVSTQRDSTARLWNLAADTQLALGPRTTAALFASVGQSEMDEPEIAVARLREVLGTVDLTSASAGLSLAALQLQLAVRAYEANLLDEAHLAVEEIERTFARSRAAERGFETFSVSKGISWGARRVQQDIASAVRRHSAALTARLDQLGGKSWVRVVRARPGWIDSQIDARSSRRDRAFLKTSFERAAASTSNRRRFGDSDAAQTAALGALLMAELNADVNEILHCRESLACLRLLEDSGDRFSTAEALRLLRVAPSADPYQSALRLVRSAGPNSALLDAARLVLARPSFPVRVNSADLLLLTTASDLLDGEELVSALSGAFAYLDGLDGQSNIGWKAYEDGWRAVARLVRGSGRDDTVAARALEFLSNPKVFGLTLAGVALSLVEALDWDQVSSSTKAAFQDWIDRHAESVDYEDLVRRLSRSLNVPLPEALRSRLSGLVLAAETANQLMSGDSVDDSQQVFVTNTVTEALWTIREQAKSGSASLGGIDAGDVAVALASRMNRMDLWASISEFLADMRVRPFLKRHALDRLASLRSEVPVPLVDDLREIWGDILRNGPDDSPFEGTRALAHFPEAVRAGAALGLMSRDDVLLAVTELAGGADSASKIEAARSVPVAVRGCGATEWGHVLLLQLSQDEDSGVRAAAGRALGVVCTETSSMSPMVVARVVELLESDGILVPLLTLHGLQESTASGQDLADGVVAVVRGMAKEHAARVVRGAAAILLDASPAD